MYSIHIIFDNRWITIFKFNVNNDKTEIDKILTFNKVNSDNERTGIRDILKTNVPENIRNPSFEITLLAMRTQDNIVRFKSHSTGEYRNYLFSMTKLTTH